MSFRSIVVLDEPHGPLTRRACLYAWQQLACRAGVNPSDSHTMAERIPAYYCSSAHTKAERPSLIIIPCSDAAWSTLLERSPHTVDWVTAKDAVPVGVLPAYNETVPVPFWGAGYEEGRKPFAERQADGTVVFYADILAATFLMLSRWEETVTSISDLHERFPATASVAYKQGFLDRPIVDAYALILQAWLKTLHPAWTPTPARFSIKLNHDIDHIRTFASLSQAGRTLAGDLLKRRSLRQAGQTLSALCTQTLHPEQDAYFLGIHELANLSEQHGLHSAFYFMAAEPGPYDSGYDPALPRIHHSINNLRHRGYEIGFHPGYRTLDDPDRFAWEKGRLDQVLDGEMYGGRQHYLRFRSPQTWRQWEQAGLRYDATLGYADHEGFRCGTCHPFPPFDIQQDRQLDILEIPLIVMDGTLRHYRDLTPEQGEERILTLAKRCKQVNGTFSLLWHNSSLLGAWQPWAAIYRRVLPRLAELKG